MVQAIVIFIVSISFTAIIQFLIALICDFNWRRELKDDNDWTGLFSGPDLELTISERADKQHKLYLAGDERGIYGDYLPHKEFRRKDDVIKEVQRDLRLSHDDIMDNKYKDEMKNICIKPYLNHKLFDVRCECNQCKILEKKYV